MRSRIRTLLIVGLLLTSSCQRAPSGEPTSTTEEKSRATTSYGQAVERARDLSSDSDERNKALEAEAANANP